MTAVAHVLKQIIDLFQRFVPSRRGSDGLRGTERSVFVARFYFTIGFRPAPTTERLARLDEVAEKTPGRSWTRPSTHSVHVA